ncbi:hypothetical protein M3Y96_00574100 [Aphelenchoides besseyi]|nr:hypothetical protein M3Y96_00574100 [Aphelenchoides besseyi]
MVSNRGVFIFVALLIAFTCGHYKDRPLRVRNDTSISYSVECKRVNDLKALAPEDVVKELQIRIEDCREFYLVQPQLAKSKCFSGWTQFPIYHGKNYPEEVKKKNLTMQRLLVFGIKGQSCRELQLNGFLDLLAELKSFA